MYKNSNSLFQMKILTWFLKLAFVRDRFFIGEIEMLP